MTVRYIVDTPRNKPCWDVNPELWTHFSATVHKLEGHYPNRSAIYTEEYVVQFLDLLEIHAA
jgi:hypothetical protein